MAKKRIKKLENGNYQYRIKQGNIDIVKRLDDNGNPFKKAKDAELARAKKLLELKEGLKNKTQKLKMSDIYYKYISIDKEKASSTLRKKESMWENHIKKIFGDRYVDEIELIELNLFLKELYYEDNYSYAYVEGFLKFFYLIFGTAYEANAITEEKYNKFLENKKTRLSMPTKKQGDEDEDIVTYSELELEQIYTVFKDSDLEMAFLLAYHCGLRIAEIFGLTWDNILFYENKIEIKKQLIYENGMWCFSKLKTKNSPRKIEMNKELATKLAILKTKQEKQKQELGSAYRNTEKIKNKLATKENEKIITEANLVNRKTNGEILTPNSIKYYRKKIKELYNIDFKTHAVRHTHATTLAKQNVPVYLLCQRMGHGNIDVCMKYYIDTANLATEKFIEEINKIKTPSGNEDRIKELKKIKEREDLLKTSIYIKV